MEMSLPVLSTLICCARGSNYIAGALRRNELHHNTPLWNAVSVLCGNVITIVHNVVMMDHYVMMI